MDAPQTTPGARFVDPKVLARITSLELLARTVVDGFINGLHKAPYLGVSIDFAEHRGYMPGDNIRFIDWRVFARTDRFYVKQFEADPEFMTTPANRKRRWPRFSLLTLIVVVNVAGVLVWANVRQRLVKGDAIRQALDYEKTLRAFGVVVIGFLVVQVPWLIVWGIIIK